MLGQVSGGGPSGPPPVDMENTMKVFIVAYLLLNGVWVPGELFEGWAPYEVDYSLEECETRMEEINKRYPDLHFVCKEI